MTSQKALGISSELNDYKPNTATLIEPPDLGLFRSLPEHRKSEKEGEFYHLPHIAKYLEDKWQKELYNRDCFIRLFELYAVEKDQELKDRIRFLLSEFRRAIREAYRPYKALVLDWSKYPAVDKAEVVETYVKEVVDMFNGGILERSLNELGR